MKAWLGRAWPGALLLALGLVVLAVHANRYAGFISDDAFISLRYADRLLEGQGLTWTAGERVEGYSNLAWVLATAALGALGIDLVVASRVLGFAGLCAAMAALVWLHARRRWTDRVATAFGVVALGLSGPFAIWSVGGLEQPLLLAGIAWAIALLAASSEGAGPDGGFPADRRVMLGGVLLGATCATRPDAPLFVAGAALAVFAIGGLRGETPRALAWVVVPGVLVVLLQLTFRLLYYGDWLPNTAHSKLAFTPHRLAGGADYVWNGMKYLLGLLAPAAGLWVLAVRRPGLRGTALLTGVPFAIWIAWVIVIGGDIFPGRRHLLVAVWLLAMAAVPFFADWLGGARGGRRALGVAAGLVCLVAVGIGQIDQDRAHLRARQEIVWAKQGESLGRALGQAFAPEQPLLAVTAAGALPFFSRLPAIDMLGLNDRYLALHPPTDLGTGRIAHELGDGDYVLGREPDLVIFCGTRGADRACSRGGREMQADPRWGGYTLVTLLGEWPVPVHGKVWVRTHSPRIGVVGDGRGGHTIPGWLLNDRPGSLAGLDAAGRAGALLFPGDPAGRTGLRLDPGRYRLLAEGTGPITLRVIDHGAHPPATLARGTSPLPFVIPSSGADVELRAETRADEAHLRTLRIEPTAPAATAADGTAKGS